MRNSEICIVTGPPVYLIQCALKFENHWPKETEGAGKHTNLTDVGEGFLEGLTLDMGLE